VDDAATVAEDSGATAIDVLDNDTDVDGGLMSIATVTQPVNGTVVITGGGTGLTYAPNADYCNDPPGGAPDTFTYTLTPGDDEADVAVTVTCADDPPTAVDDAATVAEDSGATAVDVLANDTDPDAGPRSIESVTDAANGTVVITGGGTGLTYAPDLDYCNDLPGSTPDTFTYTLNGGSVADVEMTVTCVDDPPSAVDDTATVTEDAAATTVDVLANDTDVDAGPKSIESVTQPENGTVVITGGGTGLTYAPNPNYCNDPPGTTPDAFDYTLNGGSVGAVEVTVTCVNDAPSFTVGPNQAEVANQLPDGSPRAYTIDPWATGISPGPANESGQTVDFVIDSVSVPGLFTVQPAVSLAGVLTFTTNPANTGTATITLHLHDNGGTENGGDDTSATQTFTIQTVVPPPVAVNDAYTATGNIGINVNTVAEGVLQRGTDDTLFGATITHCGGTDATTVAVSGTSCTTPSASGGAVVLNTNGTFTYNPPAGFTGADHFFYRLTNQGGTSTGDVTITASDMIWFVDNTAPACTTLAGNCGRLANPFSTLAAFAAVNTGAAPNPQPGHTVFVYSGSGNYVNGVTLLNNQRLIGQGAGESIAAISGITLAPFSNPLPATGGTRPTFTTTTAATNAVTLGSGNIIRGLNIANKTGSGIAGTGFGTLTVNEMTISGTGQALNLTTGTANATFTSVSSTSGTNGIKLDRVAGTLNFGTGGTLTGATGNEFHILNGNNTYTYPGAITYAGSERAVNISNRTGGTITLSGPVTATAGTGILLSSNTGATINLTGGVQLSTGTNPALTATGGGTVTVTGAANTLATTTGTALNIANTTIGANGLTFRSISANGGTNGIVLTNTGTTAGLTVTGNGGTCSSPTTCTGGAIQNSTGPGIQLSNVGGGVNLTRININSGADDGLRGSGVTGLNLTNVSVAANGNAVGEAGVDLSNLSGTSAWSGASVSGSAEDNVVIRNSTSTMTLDITSSTFSNNSSIGNDGILVEAASTATIVVTVANSSFSAHRGDHFQAAALNSGVLDVTFTNNTLSGGHPTALGQGITLNAATGVPGYAGSVTYDIAGNTINGAVSNGITVVLGTSAATSSFVGTIQNNIIGTSGVALSCSSQANGVYVDARGNGTHTSAVTSNVIRQCFDRGILSEAGDGNGVLNLTVQANTIDQQVGSATREAIQTNHGLTSTNVFGIPDSPAVCLQLGGPGALANVFSHGAGAPDDFRLRKRFGATVRLPGYTGGTGQDAGSLAQVVAFIQGQNTGSSGEPGSASASGAGGGYTGGAACPLPP
jgi:hypothetical protein